MNSQSTTSQQQRTALSRREAILTGSAVTISSLLLPSQLRAQQPVKDLIFRTDTPRNAEPELSKLVQSWLTPTKHFYVRSHAPNPKISADSFRLEVEGLVRRPISMSLGDLKRYTNRATTATLTCAGNRRSEFSAEGKVGGVQWEAGAIGNAKWAGFLLADVLKHAELEDNAKHVWFEGLDEIEKGGKTIPFGGSIPIEKAMLSEGPGAPLLADKMNDTTLTPDHGYPLRTLVPGYIGARSVKWLGKIVVSDRPSPNHYLATAYKIVKDTAALDWSESGPIYRYPINAAICNPVVNAQLNAGTIDLSGYALPSGKPGSRIKQVFVSSGDDKRWVKAKLHGEANDFCWSLWNAKLKVQPSTKQLLVRAVDTNGQFMPYRVPWNAKGYLQNSWFKLPIQVDG